MVVRPDYGRGGKNFAESGIFLVHRSSQLSTNSNTIASEPLKMRMNDPSNARNAFSPIGPLGVMLSHGIVLFVFYLVLTNFVSSLKFHYNLMDVVSTPVSARIALISDCVISYSLISILIVIADAVIILLMAKLGSPWLPIYSHVVHSSLAIMIFLSIAMMLQPLFLDDAKRFHAKTEDTVLTTLTSRLQLRPACW